MKIILSLLLFLSFSSAGKFELLVDSKSLHVDNDTLYLETNNGEFKKIIFSNQKIKLLNFVPLKKESRPKDILLDGLVTYGNKDINSTWLFNETTQYAHGVLGDVIEAKSLTAILKDGMKSTYTLDKDLVFEDRFARLFDINDDGKDEIFVITTNVNNGASLFMFEIKNDKISQKAKTDFIGKSNRWLNVVGFGDVNGNGIKDVTVIITPHIGGYLTVYEYKNGKLTLIHEKYGFTNHYYGNRELGMSKVSDLNSDGIDEIIVLEQNAQVIKIINYKNNNYNEIRTIKNSAKINSAILAKDLDNDGEKELIYTLENNKLVIYKNH